ncbi:hypothetical protein [Knoellia aerolata]|uniref:Uncharacterized protein n=1 Tax=Knoellia aerolata DSM 18566 TaxID=1385519 RepID=A0A0A0JVB3_9MICO|nr:hypothetical protein [Knoellia aerolata]KGN41365.1 hypothetical protein N801_07970 [Knoellia aerolata DSM 18566]
MGSLLFLAIGIPYVGFVINGEMPFVEDERGMSAVGLILGAAAYLVLRKGDPLDRVGKLEAAVAIVSLALGLAALAFAETAAAAALLATFMGSLVVLWAVELVDHAGWVRHGTPTRPVAHG